MAQGTVTDLVRDAMIVKLDCGPQLRAPLSGRMRTNKVRVVAGDRVSVELNS
jgi:translation initiation factor IF-1